MRAIALAALLLSFPALAAPAPIEPERPAKMIKSYIPKDSLDKYPEYIRIMFEGPRDYDQEKMRFDSIER